MLRLKQAEIQQEVREVELRLAQVEARLSQLQQGESGMDVVVKSAEALPVVSLARTIPDFSHIDRMFGDFFGAIGRYRLQGRGPFFALYPDTEYMLADIQVEVALPLGALPDIDLALEDGTSLRRYHLPAVESMASLIYHGSYDSIGQAYGALGEWMARTGYRPAGGAVREIYLVGKGHNDDPSTWITEIQWPMQPQE
jgi:effector-binding domain-containing protein